MSKTDVTKSVIISPNYRSGSHNEVSAKQIRESRKLYLTIKTEWPIKHDWDNDKKVIKIFFYADGRLVKTFEFEGNVPSKEDFINIFEQAKRENSTVVVAQNTIDNDIFPKPEDTVLLEKVKTAARGFRALLKDYVIFSNNGFYSFAVNRLNNVK